MVARAQTSGRGRLGRKWVSEDRGNLYASFAFRPELRPSRMQDFTLWMGLNVCELIQNFCKITPGLKWPNDILVDGRKVGGILTEARVDADQVRELSRAVAREVRGGVSWWRRWLGALSPWSWLLSR